MAQRPLYTLENGMPVLDIGRMRHPITIQSYGLTSPPTYDATGPMQVWTPFTTAMAAIEIVRGKDVILGGQTATNLNLTLLIWFQPGILADMQVISDNGSLYVITSVENIEEMDVALILNCLAIGVNQ